MHARETGEGYKMLEALSDVLKRTAEQKTEMHGEKARERKCQKKLLINN